MSQIQPVPGPSQDAFNAVVDHLETHSVSGTESVSVPSGAKDMDIFVRFGTSGGLQALTFAFTLPAINSSTTGLNYTQGYYISASSYGFCQIVANNNNTISIVSLIIGGTECKTTSNVTVYYKL